MSYELLNITAIYRFIIDIKKIFSNLNIRSKNSTEMSNYDTAKLEQYVNEVFDKSALPSLQEYVRIPNLSRSYDPKWAENGLLQKAAEHIKGWVDRLQIKGLNCEILKDEGFSPLLFTEIQGTIKETVFFYGHYDKQPPFEGWDQGLGATIPVVKDGKLYGRGGADDGYATYGTMLAIKALMEQGVDVPRCVMITQGDEESGSTHMFHYLPKLKERIGEPSVFFCLDSGTFDYDTFWLTNSLRGNMVATLRVETLKEGIHSGDISGVAPSCLRVVRHLLGRIQNPQTGEICEKFHSTIPANRYKENYDLAQLKGKEAVKSFPFVEGCHAISDDPLTCLLNRGWKPTLTVTGQTGFPKAEGAGNVMNPFIEIRFSLRMPPNLNSQEAEKNLREILTTNVPYNATVELKNVRASKGWNAPDYEKYLQEAVDEASLLYYKKPRMGLSEGGSIPLINRLEQMWPKGQFIVSGVLGPNSNAHGPNEFLHLGYTKKLICCMSHILAAVSKNLKK